MPKMAFVSFLENSDGVHALYDEHTLCGDAWDIHVDGEVDELVATDKKTVTCPKCIAVINFCRGLRTQQGDG